MSELYADSGRGSAFHVDEIAMQSVRYLMQKRIGRYAAANMVASSYFDDIHNEFVLRFATDILAEVKKESFEVSFQSPLNWWQHFKQECFPAFLLKRYPVLYRTEKKVVDFERQFLFPKAYSPSNEPFNVFVIKDNVTERR